MKALKGLSLFGGLAVVLTLFLVVGCSNKSPVQPVNPDPLDLGMMSFGASASSSSEMSTLEVYDSSLIDKSAGGVIEIERGDYTHEFEVQAGAINENTLITVRSVNETVLGKDMIVFEFGPDGLEFSKSSKLRFQMAELSGISSTAYLYYYDPVKKKWGMQSSASVVGGVAEFDIDHFSKYAISD